MSEKRDIAKDRATLKTLEVDRWISVRARAEYDDDAWIEVTLSHDDDKAIKGDNILDLVKALPHYLTRTETAERRLAEVEGQLEKALRLIEQVDTVTAGAGDLAEVRRLVEEFYKAACEEAPTHHARP
jgi:hypothetical protein